MMDYDDRTGKKPLNFNEIHENEQKMANANANSFLKGQAPTNKEIKEGASYIYIPNVGNVKVPSK